MELTRETIEQLLIDNLPKGFNIMVRDRTTFYNTKALQIAFSPNTFLINDVHGQFPQLNSLNLCLDELELIIQIFGGCGGRSIECKPNIEDPKEKYLAIKSIKVPFRKPQDNNKAIERALKKYCERYIQTLKDNRHRLLYKDVVDYSFLN